MVHIRVKAELFFATWRHASFLQLLRKCMAVLTAPVTDSVNLQLPEISNFIADENFRAQSFSIANLE